jgi:acyl carrier protein
MSTTATREEIEERVASALVTFGVEPTDINRDAAFEQLDVDSLDLVELAQIVEDEYGVQLKGEDVQNLRTVGDALDLISSRLG